jgi:hypothetical protein
MAEAPAYLALALAGKRTAPTPSEGGLAPPLRRWLGSARCGSLTVMAVATTRVVQVVTDSSVVFCERCKLAEHLPSWMRGLFGRSGLEAGRGR